MRNALLIITLLAAGCGGIDPSTTGQQSTAPDTVTPETPVTGNPWILEGSYVITNSIDASDLTGCVSITGNLEITGPGLRHLAGLENLERIGGQLRIHHAPDLVNLEALSKLAVVDRALLLEGVLLVADPIGEDSLDSVELPALEEVGGQLRILNSGAVREVSFPVLGRVGGNLDIVNTPSLPTCSAMQLVSQLEGKVAGVVSVRGTDDGTACQ